jgi:hypothetical protein
MQICRSALLPPVVRKRLATLPDQMSIPLDRSDVIVVAEVHFLAKHAAQISGSPPVNRKAIDDERGNQLHGSQSARL